MYRGSHALLAGLVDYAGLFPPADLDLDPAVRNFAAYRSGPDAWMLGRFVVPGGRLAELDRYAPLFASAAPARFSVLGYPPAEGASGGDPWLDAARRTLGEARALERRQPGLVVCDRFEIKVPASLAADVDALADALGELDGAYRETRGGGPRAALEVPYLDAPETVGAAAQAISDANGRAGQLTFSLKFRCGGVTAELVPSVERLAAALADTLAVGTPFKATAGLHHPLPNDDEAVGARMHGFVNVFGGTALARVHGLGADDLAEILDDADPQHWALNDDGLSWRSLQTSPAELADTRDQLALSFGSCSFDEPREDLRALGWL